MKYLLFKTAVINVASQDIKFQYFIFETDDSVNIVERNGAINIYCTMYTANQKLPFGTVIAYDDTKKEYKIVVSPATITTFSRVINIFVINIFIGIFDTKEDAELYYNLQ